MKHYFYSENDEQLGPFTLDELKEKYIKKSTLVWTEGLIDWITADKLDELKDFLISEPPPLPKKEISKNTKQNTTNDQKKSTHKIKIDSDYQKESEATIVGVLLLLIPLVINLTSVLSFENVNSYRDAKMWISISSLIVRLISTNWAVKIIKRQNRNTTIWGLFTFFFPSFSLIIIGQLQKLKLKIEIDDSLPKEEQISILIMNAKELFSDKRYNETIFLVNRVIEIDNENFEAKLLRGISNFHLKEYENAQNDFQTLKEIEIYKEQVLLYLGIIESYNFNYEKAINYWIESNKTENIKAQFYLDIYSNFKGKYLLDKINLHKKIGPKIEINGMVSNEQFLSYKKGMSFTEDSLNLHNFKTEFILHEYGFCCLKRN
jgi:tetratricopeptide (TPR) repeat protein